MTKFLFHKLSILLIGVFLGLLFKPCFAHPNGVSKIDVFLRNDTISDSLIVKVDVNKDDLFNALHFKAFPDLPDHTYPQMADLVEYYFQTRLDLKIDNASPSNMQVLAWRSHGSDLTHKLDSADWADTTIVLKLAWPIPKDSKRLEIAVKFFAEFGIQPLSHVRIFYREQEIKSQFLGLDDHLSIPIQHDSLEAAFALAKNPASPDKNLSGENQNASAQNENVITRFLWLGYTHILPKGLDHILFVLGLFFFSTLLRPLFMQVTAFTIAHSLTLALSLLGVFSLPSRVVEPLIALSIVIVAIENVFFRKMNPSRWIIVFAFGLIHGLGFAGVLKQLGLPKGQFFKVLISFNAGVELGQLTVIAAATAVTIGFWGKPWYFKRVVVPVSLLIAAVGLYWFFVRVF